MKPMIKWMPGSIASFAVLALFAVLLGRRAFDWMVSKEVELPAPRLTFACELNPARLTTLFADTTVDAGHNRAIPVARTASTKRSAAWCRR